MANPAAAAQSQTGPEQIVGMFEQAHLVIALSEQRFDVGEQIEALDAENPQIATMREALGQLGTPMLARMSARGLIESMGAEEFDAAQALLGEWRTIANEGRRFERAELAGLALPLYLSRQEQAVRSAAGSEPVRVSRFANSLRGAITGDDMRHTPVDGPVTGMVGGIDVKRSVLSITPVVGEEFTSLYHVEPIKTSGKHEGKRQVRIEAAEIEEAQAEA